jgi:L-amino acid N-acyltransferase YncA
MGGCKTDRRDVMAMNLPPREPREIVCDGVQLELARMTRSHRGALVDLVATLPDHDLLFVERDIAHPRVVGGWLDAAESGEIPSLVVMQEGVMVGCSAIVTDALSWSRHVGELRVLVGPAWRGRGIGRLLIQACFAEALGLGLEKLVARMTIDQRAAIVIFEELGFRAEALLRRHVADRAGTRHDLVLLSHDLQQVAARNDLLGLDAALASP